MSCHLRFTGALFVLACHGSRGDTGLPASGQDEPLARVDVLVVGAGPAGLAAAADAAEAGATVLVVDRDATYGGAARWSAGLSTFSGSPLQDATGVEDSPELLLEEWAAITGGDPLDPWVQAFAWRNLEDVYDWLGEDATWILSTERDPGASVPRVHAFGDMGDGLADRIAARVPEGSLALQTEATGLVRDDSGRFVGMTVVHEGALAEDGAPGEGWVEAGVVVLATGSFFRDLDMVAEADPTLDTDALCFSVSPEADGNGHRMLEAVGAVWDNPSAIGIYAHGTYDPRDDREDLILRPLERTVWVDADGARFVDESAYRTFAAGRRVADRPDGLAWAIFDAPVRAILTTGDPMTLDDETEAIPSADDLEDRGQLVSADTLDALAGLLGLDPDTLTSEVDAFNEACEAGEGDAWRTDLTAIPPIAEPPYFGIQVVPVLAKAFGGIAVDEAGRVVDAAGDAIPGLYAAGELTGMAGGSMVGDTGFTGSLSAVILSGRVAGTAAAAEALAR